MDICVLLKNNILEKYSVINEDKSYDGILAMSLKCKTSGTSILIIASYLPPENSPFGRNSLEFF